MMKCNGCWEELEAKSQCIATACGHLYCVACAQQIVQSDESACPICENVITKSNVKLVNILQDTSAYKLQLCGQTPETALNCALASVNFYLQQQQLMFELREQKMQQKILKVQEACRKKLQEVHNGYMQAKKKYQEVLQFKANLEADNQELQQKYAQKAMQTRKLQELIKKVQQENEVLRTGRQRSQQSGQYIAPQMDMMAPGRSPPPGHTVTTVHRKQTVFTAGGPGLSPGMRFGPGPGNLADGGRQAVQGGNRNDGMSPLKSVDNLLPDAGFSANPRGGQQQQMGRNMLQGLLGGSNNFPQRRTMRGPFYNAGGQASPSGFASL